MKIEVYEYVLPCNREDEVTVIGPDDLIHAFENKDIMYVSSELLNRITDKLQELKRPDTKIKLQELQEYENIEIRLAGQIWNAAIDKAVGVLNNEDKS